MPSLNSFQAEKEMNRVLETKKGQQSFAIEREFRLIIQSILVKRSQGENDMRLLLDTVKETEKRQYGGFSV